MINLPLNKLKQIVKSRSFSLYGYHCLFILLLLLLLLLLRKKIREDFNILRNRFLKPKTKNDGIVLEIY